MGTETTKHECRAGFDVIVVDLAKGAAVKGSLARSTNNNFGF